MKNPRILATALCTSALIVSALVGCSDGADSHAAHDHDDHAGHDHSGHDHASHDKVVRTDTYEGILGRISALPIEGDPSSQLRIYHEHIPTFRTKQGTVFVNSAGVPGMNAMDMEFPPAEGVSLDGFAIGDKVRFSFDVNWGGERAWEVTQIEKLDADTEIDFSVKPTPKELLEELKDAGVHDHDDHSGHDHDEP